MSLSTEERKVLHLLAKRKSPDYLFKDDTQFISSIVFLKRNTSPCLICNKEVVRDLFIIHSHGLNHLKEYNLMVFI